MRTLLDDDELLREEAYRLLLLLAFNKYFLVAGFLMLMIFVSIISSDLVLFLILKKKAPCQKQNNPYICYYVKHIGILLTLEMFMLRLLKVWKAEHVYSMSNQTETLC